MARARMCKQRTSARALADPPVHHSRALLHLAAPRPRGLQARDALFAEANATKAAGAVCHDEFSNGDGRRAFNHTMVWLATGREAHADKAVEILDAWCVYGGGGLEVGRGLGLSAQGVD